MNKQELIAAMNFDSISTTGQIKYDVEKLRWVNHKWIAKLSTEALTDHCLPYLHEAYPTTQTMDRAIITKALSYVHQEMVTLRDCVTLLAFYFDVPVYEQDIARTITTPEKISTLSSIVKASVSQATIETFLASAKKEAATAGIGPKELFSFLRYGLTGSVTGIGIVQLGDLLGYPELQKRLLQFLPLVR